MTTWHVNSAIKDKHAHSLTLVDVVELADAERMQHLFELAQLRNVPLER